MSAESEAMRRQSEMERRLQVFVAAVTTGWLSRTHIPRRDFETAAAEIVEFAVEIEKASRGLFS